ncbi:Utp14 protein [Saccharomycopsis crataegensis]|uniref:Utp14 protein n=1 Tax=Saccharomycopsis crataegensis TaxID=43959 RepID=A0AAV5QQM6_9ASCO|nr:Utp14 protein [Saccharomycopsis crataegensis]
MALKSTFKNGALVLLNPKTGEIASDDDSDALNDFSDESIDSDEFDSEYASDNSGEFSFDEEELRPLSEIWDMEDDKSDTESKSSIKLDAKQEELDELSSSDDEEEESEEEDSSDESNSESEEDIFADSSDEGELNTVMDKLKKSKKKSEKQKKKLITLNVKENEFGVPTNGAKLSLTEMMESANGKATLLKDADQVKPLAIPLPKRIQERNERSAAYEISKKEVDKWKDDVERIKRAEVVKFPLIGNTVENKKVSVFTMSDKPMTELESMVNGVLEESLLTDTKKEALFEQVQVAKMSKEDMIKRQNELRLMRDLLFREERKSKRIKKIKSKSYRRIKKKEMLKNKELLNEFMDDEDANAQDESRAEARMTLKFKNSSSKWAKDMLKHGMTKDKETRAEMEAMLQQGQRLREKVLGRNEDSDDDDVELEDLENASSEDEEELVEKKASVGKSGFMNMSFMKKAEAREKEKNREDIEKLRNMEQGLDIEDFDDASTKSAKVILNKGRKIFTPDATKASKELQEQNKKTVEEQKIDESHNLENSLENKFKSKSKGGKKKKNQKKSTDDNNNKGNYDPEIITEAPEEDAEEANPWLGENITKAVKKSSKVKVVDQTSTKAEKQAHKLQKSKNKSRSVASQLELIDTAATLHIGNKGFDDGSEDEGQEVETFKQKDIIKEAFAGDNVVKEFEGEKKRVIDEEDDQWVNAEQPGFNSWIGGNEKQRKKQKKDVKMKKVKGIKSADQRTDKNLKNVIFNEKVNKKNMKYQSDGVPFPYENKEQYERSLRMPIGQEWTTRGTFQRMTMPSVITKSGQVIKPLTKKSSK